MYGQKQVIYYDAVSDRVFTQTEDEDMTLLSRVWTGRDDPPKIPVATREASRADWVTKDGAVAVLDRPKGVSKPSKLEQIPTMFTGDKDQMVKYKELATKLGIDVPVQPAWEIFRAFLTEIDMPVYSLKEVVKYMDDVAERDNPKRTGWRWAALRSKDTIATVFGREAIRDEDFDRFGNRLSSGSIRQSASDLYRSSTLYAHVVPFHALSKIAKIEDNYKGPGTPKFMVSDYEVVPRINERMVGRPDPFLMVVMENPELSQGIGRYVIDFWDEPGFGFDKQFAPE
jgi:hypothetical protein